MTPQEIAYQNFVFKHVTYEHKQALTESERVVYTNLKIGRDYRQISERLEMNVATVRMHKKHICDKGWLA